MLPGRLHVPQDCRLVADVLARIGDKWSVMLIMLLGERKQRFSDLNRSLGSISKRMLSLTLRRLERDGVVKRTVYDTMPPSVEYELTALGHSLWPTIRTFGHWVVDHQDDIESARSRYDDSDRASVLCDTRS